jgi:hypothetical protein
MVSTQEKASNKRKKLRPILNEYGQILSDITYAIQDIRVVELIGSMVDLKILSLPLYFMLADFQ